MNKLHNPNRIRLVYKIILAPLAFLAVVVAFPAILVVILYFFITGSLQYATTNSLRWLNGKTPHLYCLSKDCLIWSHTQAIEAAQKAVEHFQSIASEIKADWPNTCLALAEEALAIIKSNAAPPQQIYHLCQRIRQDMRKIKGIPDLFLLHDYLLEKADNSRIIL